MMPKTENKYREIADLRFDLIPLSVFKECYSDISEFLEFLQTFFDFRAGKTNASNLIESIGYIWLYSIGEFVMPFLRSYRFGRFKLHRFEDVGLP